MSADRRQVPTSAFDEGNHMLSECPAGMTAIGVKTPDGPRLLVTIRTPSTTLSVYLSTDDVRSWAGMLIHGAQGLGSALIVPEGLG